MQEPESLWTYKEFVTFLLIYAAHADVEFSSEEYEFIKSYSDLETYKKMMNIYDDMTEFEVLEMLKSYKKYHYPTEEAKAKIMSTMNDLFHADGSYTKMEQTLSLFLGHLL